jgi:uncharacterized Fe-S radical SAM superfamily protein PflX
MNAKSSEQMIQIGFGVGVAQLDAIQVRLSTHLEKCAVCNAKCMIGLFWIFEDTIGA